MAQVVDPKTALAETKDDHIDIVVDGDEESKQAAPEEPPPPPPQQQQQQEHEGEIPAGLSTAKATELLQTVGKNEIPDYIKPVWRMVLDQVRLLI